MFLFDLARSLEEEGIEYALVGGYAVSLHGAPRGTVDIDLVIKWSLKNLKKIEKGLGKLGLVSRLPIDAESLFHFKKEYIEKRNLVAWNFYDPKNPSRQVDIIVTYDLKGSKVKSFKTRGGNIKVLSRQDLIEMKRKSGRKQDMEDVKSLENLP